MPEIIQQLHTDHIHASKLLGIMEEQIGLLQTGEVPNYVLMTDIMQYMIHYPDLFHHPREDILFQRIAKRDESTRSMVADLIRGHGLLEHQGKALFDLLRTVIHEHPVARETLEAKTREYVSTLRLHMDLEEKTLFSMARKVLQAKDWEEVDSVMGNREDPLFGGNIVETEYKILYDYIQSHGS